MHAPFMPKIETRSHSVPLISTLYLVVVKAFSLPSLPPHDRDLTVTLTIAPLAVFNYAGTNLNVYGSQFGYLK